MNTKPLAYVVALSVSVVSGVVFAQAVVATPAATAPQRGAQTTLGADHFAAGKAVQIDKPVAGDLLAAGAEIDVDADVGGDAALAGGAIRLNANVGQSLYLGGGQVTVNGRVGRNARIAGGRVALGTKSQFDGNVTVTGGRVTINGPVKGYVQVSGGTVLINSAIGGDVIANGGELALGPNARIVGKLRYASREPLQRDVAAQIRGGVEVVAHDDSSPMQAARHTRRFSGMGFIWTVGLMVLAGLLIAVTPRSVTSTANTLRAKFGLSLGAGLGAILGVPILVILLMVTILGIPIGLLVLLAYPALLLLGYVLGAVGIGSWLLNVFGGDKAQKTLWKIAAALATILLLALLGYIPYLGGVVRFAVLFAGVGAVTLTLLNAWRAPKPQVSTGGA